jgi:hypothetical protein
MKLVGYMLAGMLSLSTTAEATEIDYSITGFGGNAWRYSYTVSNTSLSTPISEFTVYFDRALYSSLAPTGAPFEWDPLVAQPDANLPANGFYDALSFGAGLAPGETLSSFLVDFNYLGEGTPGSQPFDIVDSSIEPIGLLDSGQTKLGAPSTGLPEPNPSWLLLIGAGLCGALHALRSKRLA